MDFDPTRLAQLGKARLALRAKLDDNRDQLTPEVLAALRAGLGVVQVATLAGMTREWVRQLARANEIQAG